MRPDYLKNALRFCCTIDDSSTGLPLTEKAETALKAGATMIRYEGGDFSSESWPRLQALCHLCKSNGVPFIVTDHILLAKAIGADGIHLGQSEERLESARGILGPGAITGKSMSFQELSDAEPAPFDYIELLPFHGIPSEIPERLLLIAGNISTPSEAERMIRLGARGITVSLHMLQSRNPGPDIRALAEACSCPPRDSLFMSWPDEFDLIEKLLQSTVDVTKNTGPLIVPPGDDACLLTPLSRPVISTDTQKEGVHFRRDWQTPDEIGYKAVSVTLSDLAASYAHPVSLFVNLGLPPHISEPFIEKIYRGINMALADYGCSLGGGNISSGRELSLDLFAIGQGREDIFPKRSEARPGFGLYVTGPLGLARAGLEALERDDTGFPQLVKRFKHPRARFDAAHILAAHGVTCVMDISDGLMGDVGHMAKASALTIELDPTGIPFEPPLISFCKKYNHRPEAIALAGGEDYELLFACAPEIFNRIRQSLPNAIQVGHCMDFRGDYIDGGEIGIASYRHGAQTGLG